MTRIHRAIYDSGAMVRVSGNNIMTSPPLIVSESAVAQILSALDAGLSAV